MLRVGSENAIEPNLVLPRGWDERGEAPEKIEWGKEDFGFSGVVRLAQLEAHLALGCQREAFLREGRAHAVAQQALELLILMPSLNPEFTDETIAKMAKVGNRLRIIWKRIRPC